MDDRLVTEITDQEIKEMYDRIVAAGTSDIPQNSDPQPVPAASDDQELVDNYGFPFEPEGIYNSTMLDFEEVAEALWGLILQTHYCATRYHRLSPNYTLLMQILEKHIRQMGSYCITQAVLEQSGREFKLIKGAELKELCGMVSLHFRKCCRAYNTIYSKDQCQDLNMMKWIFRWAALFERLKATQEKIDKIKSGKLKIETLLETQDVYKDEPRMRRDHSDKAVDPRLKASAMPIMTSYTSEVKLQKKAEEKRERALQREAERAKKRFEKGMDRLSGQWSGAGVQNTEQSGQGSGVRDQNIVQSDQRAVDGGQKAGPVIHQAGAPPRSGPSEETRRKLREKRKKKK